MVILYNGDQPQVCGWYTALTLWIQRDGHIIQWGSASGVWLVYSTHPVDTERWSYYTMGISLRCVAGIQHSPCGYREMVILYNGDQPQVCGWYTALTLWIQIDGHIIQWGSASGVWLVYNTHPVDTVRWSYYTIGISLRCVAGIQHSVDTDRWSYYTMGISLRCVAGIQHSPCGYREMVILYNGDQPQVCGWYTALTLWIQRDGHIIQWGSASGVWLVYSTHPVDTDRWSYYTMGISLRCVAGIQHSPCGYREMVILYNGDQPQVCGWYTALTLWIQIEATGKLGKFENADAVVSLLECLRVVYHFSPQGLVTFTHTHTHIYIYIYIHQWTE